ncbi:MAG: TolC family protein [Rhodospirillales bacterium]|nr:TolC family protein [Rhodospirillales bacterium]
MGSRDTERFGRQAELVAVAESARIGFEKAALYPSISLSGNFGYLASDWGQFDLSDVFMTTSQTWQVGPAVQWNILNYGQITNRVRAQDASFQAAIFAYQNTVLLAQREVEDGLSQFLQSQKRTQLQSRSADFAKQSLDLSVLQYREGIVDFTTVLTAQQDLLNAQDLLVQATGDTPQGLILTYRALGGGWQIREGQNFVPPEVQEVMTNRTDWGNILTPVDMLRPTAPGLPAAEDVSPRVRAPEW